MNIVNRTGIPIAMVSIAVVLGLTLMMLGSPTHVSAQGEPTPRKDIHISAQGEPTPRAYITAAIGFSTDATVSWSDPDSCPSEYNIYAGWGTRRIHLGSAASGSTEATVGITIGESVELYCGAYDPESSENVKIASTQLHRYTKFGHYSSAPLTGLSISSGTLSPTFNRGIGRYAAEVASDVSVITLDPTVLNLYQIEFIKNPVWGLVWSCSNITCSYSYGDGVTTGIKLSDADTETPGFQVNLVPGENRLGLGVNRGTGADDLPGALLYYLTITVQTFPATGQPTISGTAQVGQTLIADASGISDINGLTNATFSYQWLSIDRTELETEIDGATSSTYALQPSDYGKAIRVRVTFTDDAGNAESLTSPSTATVTAVNSPASGAPSISGTAQVEQTLTASTSGIADSDGLTYVTYSYQWLADDVSISGATSSTYTLTDSEEGKIIKTRVTFTDDRDNQETLTSAATEAVVAAPSTPLVSPTPVSPQGEPTPQAYVTVLLSSGIDDVVSWSDPDACPSEYHIYDVTYYFDHISHRLLGTAASGSTEATVFITGGIEAVRVYCGAYDPESSENVLLASVRIHQGYFASGYYSSAPLTGLSISPGTLSPTFDRGITKGITYYARHYTVEVASDVNVITLDPTVLRGYQTDFIKNPGLLTVRLCGSSCVYGYGGTILSDADTETPGFQVNLDRGANRLGLGLHGATDRYSPFSAKVYRLTVTVQNSSATGQPTLSGTAQVGQTLTADASGISDIDGLTNATFSYQWLSIDPTELETEIYGATSSTYALQSSDHGKGIRIRVSFTDDAGYEESVTSSSTATVTPVNSPASGAPSISGTTQVEQTLTASTSGITDSDGLTNVAYSYQWLADDANISGATSSSYTLTDSEEGKTVKARVTFTDDRGNQETLTSAATAAVAALPNADPTGAPDITGTVQVGKTLTASTSGITDSDGLTNAIYSYQWLADDAIISGATSSTYILTDSEEGKTIKARVTFTDDRGNQEALTSAATAAVAARPNTDPTGAPDITGTVQVGKTLTASTSGIADSDGLTNVTYSYQWLADDANIGGATGSTYTLVAADVRKAIKVRVTFTDDRGTQESVTSDPTEEVPGMWAGTVIAVNDPSGSGAVGYSVFVTGMGYITAPEFVANGAGNSVDAVAYDREGLHLALSRELSTPFTLHVDTKTFDSSSASTSEGSESYIYTWSQPGLSWTQGDSILIIIVTNSPATGTPTISGSVQVGQTLTVDTSDIADEDGSDNATFAYQWARIDGTTESDIRDATGSIYTLTADDEGKIIKVRVSFTDDVGNGESLASAATEAVSGNRPHDLEAAVQNGAIVLTWKSQVITRDNADDYRILRHRPELGEPGPLVYVDYTFNSATSYTDTDVETGVLYVYQVQATINLFGDLSEASEPVEIRMSEGETNTQQIVIENTQATGQPNVDGAPEVGETLTADTSGISDDDGLVNVSFTYQWLSDDANIAGATGSTYTLTFDDEGKTIKVRVSFTDDRGNQETLISADTGAVTASPSSLTANVHSMPASHDGSSVFTFELRFSEEFGISYKALRDHAFMVSGGEVNKARRLERGKNLRWEISVTPDGNGDVTVVLPVTTDCSAQGAICTADGRKLSNRVDITVTGPVAARANSAATGAPTISGTAQVGETLTVSTSGIADEDGLDNASFSYQWDADDSDISGATGSTYTLVDVDESRVIRVKVSFTDDSGNDESLASVETEAVAAKPNVPATGAPTISGTAQAGETLTADTSGISDEDGLDDVTFSYQWLTDDSDIVGATGSSYTLTDSDEGKAIKVWVSFTDDEGNAESLTSTATSAVAATPTLLTAQFLDSPGSHDGQTSFTFELRFSEEFGLSYVTLQDHAFTVSGGDVTKARRLERQRNIRWEITVRPNGNGNVTVVLPATDNCDDRGSICTEDGRRLSNRTELTISGPGG